MSLSAHDRTIAPVFTTIPPDRIVHGTLEYSAREPLPDHLTVWGHLVLTNHPHPLPAHLKVGLNFIAAACPAITSLGPDCLVEGDVIIDHPITSEATIGGMVHVVPSA